ncbi:uncharacterized protein ACWYII_024248 isoform 3-T4 [Salvelinus alpinus]
MRASRATMDLQSPPDVMRVSQATMDLQSPPDMARASLAPVVLQCPLYVTFVVSSGYPAMETFLGLHVLPGPPGPPGPALAGSVGPITDNLAQAMLVSDVSPKNVVVCLVFDDIPRHPGDIGHLQLYEHFK